MPSTYITRTFSTNSVSNRKFTYSFWVKRSNLGEQTLTCAYSDNTYFAGIKFDSSNRLEVYDYRGSYKLQKITTRLFRDISAWYHIVVASDTSVSTPDTKIYINGVEETAFDTDTDYTQNHSTSFNHSYGNTIGCFNGSSTQQFFDGLMSHFHFCDGYTYAASNFGFVDSTTGEWAINANPNVSYGSNGFWVLKDGNTITDSSTNTNNWTLSGGTLTKTEDNPSNNFCTLNPLFNNKAYFTSNSVSFDTANGNTYAGKVTHCSYMGTIGVSSGKFYWEVKLQDTNTAFGIVAIRPNGGVSYAYDDGTVNAYYPYTSNNLYINGSNQSGGAYDNSQNKTYSFALDATNNKMWIGRDGTFTGDPANGTGATWSSLPTGHQWTPFVHSMATTQNNNTWLNFGNGYLGTTAVSSAGTNASGNGIFEYNVPSGFTALSTKGLNL